MRYSIGTSWFTSSGRSLRKIFPTTSTRLSTAIAKRTLTSNSRLTNRSISFISLREISTTQIPLHDWHHRSRGRRTADEQQRRPRHHIVYNGEGNSSRAYALPCRLRAREDLCESVAKLHLKGPEQRGQIA